VVSLTIVRLWKTLHPAETVCLALLTMRARGEAAGPAALEVDFEDLSQLVDTLRTLAGGLSRDGALCGHVNDPDLADAIGRVERNWHKHRVTLQTFLDSAATSVAASLAGYRRIEREIAGAASAGP
jgi:hypothetical protein